MTIAYDICVSDLVYTISKTQIIFFYSFELICAAIKQVTGMLKGIVMLLSILSEQITK